VESLCLLNPPLDEVAAQLKRGGFFWLDLESPSADQLRELGEMLKLHPLTMEDLPLLKERPKFDEYPDYAFMVAWGAEQGTDEDGQPRMHPVHMVVSGNYVVTIHTGELTELKTVRERYGDQQLRSEQMLIYRILDAIASTYFPVLADIDDEIDDIEEHVIDEPTREMLQRIFVLKRRLFYMRRIAAPMRDVFARNAERISDLPGMEADDRLYFRDLYDTMIRIAELVDAYRDLLSGVTDLYMSTVANRQGEVNKQLTIIATIFLPLTFLTGFFGQNFSFLTTHVLNTTLSFLLLGLGLLVASAIAFAIFFRTRRWV
jgi:magnesium transporter